MRTVNSNNEIIEKIENNSMTIVYFSGATCGACDVIRGKAEEVLIDYPKVEAIEINAVVNLDVAAEYSVFTLPVLVLFVEGKETIRFGRYFDILDFKNNIDRYYGMLF